MTSGYMWNQIRHPQYSQMSDGKISYITGGYSNQLGAETHILATICTSPALLPYYSAGAHSTTRGADGLLAFAAYTLAFTVPKLHDPLKQRLGVYVWTGISVVLLGLLTSIFTTKQGAYPFRFLFASGP